MVFTYNKKKYVYDPTDQSIVTIKGKEAKNYDVIFNHLMIHIQAVREVGFNFNMNYNQFDTYIAALDSEEKQELFFKVYEHYLYAGDYLSGSGVSASDYHKAMAKIKRYEQYLYKITQS